MSKVKITYFDAKGRAEASRLALVVAGIDFEDERIKGEEFGKRKSEGAFPFGALPVLAVDGVEYAQSDAMLRYCGKLGGLYPNEDAVDGLKVDMVIGALEDVVFAVFKDSSVEGRKKFVEVDVEKYFAPIDKLYGQADGPFLLGDQLSVADLKLYVTDSMLKGGFIDHVPTDVLDKYSNILQCCKAVGDNEKVKEWNSKH